LRVRTDPTVSRRYAEGARESWLVQVVTVCVTLAALFVATVVSAAPSNKPPLAGNVYREWPSLGEAKLSDDGRYAAYTVEIIEDSAVRRAKTIVRSIDSPWHTEIPDVTAGAIQFSAESKYAIYLGPNHELSIVTLGASRLEHITAVKRFSLAGNDHGEWLVFLREEGQRELTIRDLATGGDRHLYGIANYWVSGNRRTLIALAQDAPMSGQRLQWISVTSGVAHTLWDGPEGSVVKSLVVEGSARQIAFIVGSPDAESGKDSIWYYKIGYQATLQLARSTANTGRDTRTIEDISFDWDPRHLVVSVNHPEPPPGVVNGVNVDVWSYRDAVLQSRQLVAAKGGAGSIEDRTIENFAIELTGGQVIPLGHRGDLRECRGEYCVTQGFDTSVDAAELAWNNRLRRAAYYSISARHGVTTRLNVSPNRHLSLSPDGRYAVYYDPEDHDYHAVSMTNGATIDITPRIHTDWTIFENDMPDAAEAVNAVCGWAHSGNAVILHDQYDLWQVDLTGVRAPINVTNGYGKAHQITLRLVGRDADRIVKSGEALLLTAFDRRSKDNGWFRKRLGDKGDPERLSMGPYIYELIDDHDDQGEPPIKARVADAYLVRRMSATESSNLFYTRDFRTFHRLSDIHPERDYNWLTTELVTWETPGFGQAQGILYKPENFDPANKYPVIFYYYEKLSDGLNAYLPPGPDHGPINIPYYVSHGYLVFAPDIHYRLGAPGDSALRAIVSAATELKKRPYVDGDHLGLQGHSFGGYETNYVVTHSGMFAAAAEGSGASDYVGNYASLWGPNSAMGYYERSQGRMGATLWQQPTAYIENSPIFNADKVTTPLLMMSNKKDEGVPFTQGIELFTALRRLGKRVWMLQYDDGDHTVNGKDALDLQTRTLQFFDYYLRSAPPPKWMTEGVPARLKGIDAGFELDTSGRAP